MDSTDHHGPQPHHRGQRRALGVGWDVNSKAAPILGYEPAGPCYLETSPLCSKLLISLPGKAQIPSKKCIHYQNPALKPRSHL